MPFAGALSKEPIYHDIYDFSLFPVSLGDILTWGVKSALRASAHGRHKVHIHLICDPQKSGFNPLQSSIYLADLLVAEAVPAFYSHPYFSGLSVYRSREDFQESFLKIAMHDEVAQSVYRENDSRFKDRSNFDQTCRYFNELCSYHEDINECHRKTGTFPKVGYLKDCLVDWQALQSQFPETTYWVTLQFRFRKLDAGMPVNQDGVLRDAPFPIWYNFISETYKKHPSVRFVVLGRLQEKPLELLRLPNVIVLRTLGMNLAHEITALLHSDLYIGSPSGFAQAAHFSDVPYDIFNCTPLGCKLYGIPYGTERLSHAVPRQRLHYGVENTELLLECLQRAMLENPKRIVLAGELETNRSSSTDRFFINDDQSKTELTSILEGQFKTIASIIEDGEYLKAQSELNKLKESFPRFVTQWDSFNWLNELLNEILDKEKASEQSEAWRARRNQLLAKVSRYCHPSRLIRSSGRHFDNLFIAEGFRRDGWCEQRTKLVFAPSDKGDFILIPIRGLAGDETTGLTVQINDQKPIPFVLLNEYSVLEIPITTLTIPTRVVLIADRACKINPQDVVDFSYQIDGGGLVSKLRPAPSFYRADKRDSREKIVSGIYSNGMASNLARIRLDNPLPEDQEIMICVSGRLSRPLRRGQHFRIQINDEEAHEALLVGKHFTAQIPCAKKSHHISVMLQFWGHKASENEPRENRALINSIDILPNTIKKPEIASGSRGFIHYAFDKLKAKIKKKLS